LPAFYSNHLGKKLRNSIGFPLHARKFSAGNLNSRTAVLSPPKHALGFEKLVQEASEAVSEPAIIVPHWAAGEIFK
jgi:hypothetical protein